MTTMLTRLLPAAIVAAACVNAGCGLGKQDKPASAGPSEFGQSLSVAVTPDRISQDGVSQATVQVTVRDANGKVTPGVTVQWSVTAWRDDNGNDVLDGTETEFGSLVEPSSQQSTTDGSGIARIAVWAPPAPVVLPTGTGKMRITAKPVGTDAMSTINERAVIVVLVPPQGTLPPNRAPIAAFSVIPAIAIINQSVAFDASLTTDEGDICGSACSYQWDFGDFEAGSGKTVTHTYWRPATFTVTLTVTDARGGVASTTRSLTVTGPVAPVAALSVTPATITAGGSVLLNGSASTIGVGGRIEEYTWDYGDGTVETTTVPIVSHSYGTVGVYAVILTVKDNFGRTSVATGQVTVNP